MIARAVLPIAGSAAALAAIYYALPPGPLLGRGRAVAILVIGLAVFIALVTLQVRSIIRSPFPGLRAIEALESAGSVAAASSRLTTQA